MLVPAAIAALALLPPGLVKPGAGVIYEGESPYQFIQVRAAARRRRASCTSTRAGPSTRCGGRTPVLTGGYWDQFLLAPVMHGARFGSLAMIGYAGGTVGRAYGACLAGR